MQNKTTSVKQNVCDGSRSTCAEVGEVFGLFDFGGHLSVEEMGGENTSECLISMLTSQGAGVSLTSVTDLPSSCAILSQRPGVPPGNFPISLLSRLMSSSLHSVA